MSKASKWTDAEKLGILFQIIDKSKIDWSTIAVPEGRTIKAVQCMIDVERKKSHNASGDGSAPATPSKGSGPKTPRTAPRKRTKKAQSDGFINDEEEMVPRTPSKKRKVEAQNSDGDDEDVKVKAEPGDGDASFDSSDY